jgi:hypothetical protein
MASEVPPPINMGVEIDQSGHHEEPTRVGCLGTAGAKIGTDPGTLPRSIEISTVSSRPLAGSMIRPPFRIRPDHDRPRPRSMGNVV